MFDGVNTSNNRNTDATMHGVTFALDKPRSLQPATIPRDSKDIVTSVAGCGGETDFPAKILEEVRDELFETTWAEIVKTFGVLLQIPNESVRQLRANNQ
jgi:hypothetical protein